VRRFDATRVFYGMEFFDTLGAQAAFTVWAVYLVQDVGVNPLQLVLLGTVSEIAIFLFEVPTGVVGVRSPALDHHRDDPGGRRGRLARSTG
jgi:hypothetical protein